MKRRNAPRPRQAGQSTAEYLVVLLVTMLAVGVGHAGDTSAIEWFLAGVGIAFDKLSSFMSLPL